MIDDERPPWAAEQLAQTHRADRAVGAIEVSGTFLEHVVAHLGAGRQRPAECRDPLDTPEHFHFGQSELFPLLKVFTWFIQEARLTKHAVGFFTIDVRRALISTCNDHIRRLRAGDDCFGTRSLVRRGVDLAREAIEGVPLTIEPGEYCDAVRLALDHQRLRIWDSPDDPDHWAAGGIGEIERELWYLDSASRGLKRALES